MLVLLLTLIITGILNLCYYFFFTGFSSWKPEKPEFSGSRPVSVIVCAKNEAENLRNFVPAILKQNYPHFELILINDASADDTLEVIEEFQQSDSRVKKVDVQNNEAFWANKKYALTLGIKKAVNPYLLFTDADCRPESPEWISRMAAHFRENRTIVLGYGGYFKIKGSFLNMIIRFETMLTAIQYFSYARAGMPYMGVGRNLAYTAEEFYRQKGFADHLHIRAGDDDLFVNQAATPFNTAVCIEKETFTRSVPKTGFREWFIQKRRHISISRHYKKKHQLLLGVFYTSQLFFWLLFIATLFTAYWQIALVILAARLLVQGVIFYNSAKKLEETDLIWFFPLLELFLISTQLGIFISTIISKPTYWK